MTSIAHKSALSKPIVIFGMPLTRQPSESRALLRRQLFMLFRRPRSLFLLGAALLVIGCGFLGTYNGLAQQSYRIDQLSIVGERMLHNYRQFSLLAIVALVPVLGVQALAQERDALTLDLLLTAPLPPLRFIYSKIGASLTAAVVAILGTLPVLALTFPMGGVGPFDVIAVVGLQVFLAYFTLLLAISMAARFSSFAMGLAATYGLLVLFLYPAYNFVRFGTAYENIIRGVPWLVMLLGFVYSQLQLIPQLLAKESKRVRPRSWRPLSMKGIDCQLWSFLGTREYGEPIGAKENPIYVAERDRFLSQVVRRHFDAPSVIWLAAILFTATAVHPGQFLSYALFISVVFTPLVGATLFASEHERKSWESLRASLIRPGQILWGKFRLTAMQGWIHAIAFYAPPLIITGMIWSMAIADTRGGFWNYRDWNTARVWIGHALAIPDLLLTTLFLAALSILISTLCRRNVSALLCTYGCAVFYLFGPKLLATMHPTPGYALGGNHPMDAASRFLTAWHSPYTFNLWPATVARGGREFNVPPMFWDLYTTHLLDLAALTLVFLAIARIRIEIAEA